MNPGVPQGNRLIRTAQGWVDALLAREGLTRADKAGKPNGPGLPQARRRGGEAWRPGAMLKINNIEVLSHEVILALKGVSLEVPSHGIVTLLGANWAGKSTTLKAVSGLLKHENGKVGEGSVEVLGGRIDRK